jgi:hypothetical protein
VTPVCELFVSDTDFHLKLSTGEICSTRFEDGTARHIGGTVVFSQISFAIVRVHGPSEQTLIDLWALSIRRPGSNLAMEAGEPHHCFRASVCTPLSFCFPKRFRLTG